VTEGYRIKQQAYALPEIDLTADEAAAVAVATKLWESPERITAAQNAVIKLRAAGIDVDPAGEVAISTGAGPRGLRGSEEALGEVLSAVEVGQAVRFRHRPNPAEPYVWRTVEPWGVVTSRGRWYLVGHDRDRAATRVFRLSRVVDVEAVGSRGEVHRPDGVDLSAVVERAIGEVAGEVSGGGRAKLWVADDRATALRQAGRVIGRRRVGERDGDVIEVELGTVDWLAREVAGYGADALVLDPASLRHDVIARLTAQASV
jgi:proteasome accessory factor B